MGILGTRQPKQTMPALMGTGAPGPFVGQIDFAQDKLHCRKIGAVASLRASRPGQYFLHVADFAEGMLRRPSEGKMACVTPPFMVQTPCQLALSGAAFCNCPEDKAVSTKDLVGPDEIADRVVAREFHVNYGHASASQLKRILSRAVVAGTNVFKAEGSVADECDVCASAGEVPHLPVAGASTASDLNEKVQAELLSVDNSSSRSPSEVWGAFAAPWITVSGKPRFSRMDVGGG